MLSKMAKKPVVAAGGANRPRQSAALDRLRKDMAELEGTSCKVTVPDINKKDELHVVVTPIEGIYRGGVFEFKIKVPHDYPYTPPKVTYAGPLRIFHPNISGDGDGGVCLNILRADWKPVLAIKDILFGLELLFFEPNPDDPLPGTSREAAQLLVDSRKKFEQKARKWMEGNYN